MKPIYLDNNASTPLIKEVIEAMTPYLQSGFGNPSSSHWYGLESKKALEKARSQMAVLLNCDPREIIFTSGGSESNNIAILGVAGHFSGGHIITCAVEHPAVLEVCRYLEKNGFEVSYISVDEAGLIDLEELKNNIRSDTVLISIMLANNEVGTIQPVREILEIARKSEIIFHTDAAQAVGKMEVDVRELGVDLLSVAGHKMYAPKGVGALYLRQGTDILPLIHGAAHERGLRPGTENILEIVGLGAAAEVFSKKSKGILQYQRRMGDEFWKHLIEHIPDIQLNGHREQRLTNTVNVYFPGIDTNTLLSKAREVAASAGAACHTDRVKPSHVLRAMGFTAERAQSSIRFSVGRTNTSEEIKRAADCIIDTVNELRSGAVSGTNTRNEKNIKLTQYTHGLGCACKIQPQNLEKILQKIKPKNIPDGVIGFENSDDAAVYPLNNDTAIVATVDFFTPIVDDAFHFGRIAAANSLSDIYAMGAEPLFALNVTAFPEKRLPLEVLEDILKGARQVANEAGIPILGGHTVEDNEPKFGMAVIGKVHPDKILKNSGAQENDVLILTKPIGFGILTTAQKRGVLSEHTKKSMIEVMAELNAQSARIAAKYPVSACTDITGYGLLGHLLELLNGSKASSKISVSQIPVFEDVHDLVQRNVVPGGTRANLRHVSQFIKWEKSISEDIQVILADAQTSGGLLFTLPEKYSGDLIADFRKAGNQYASIIGSIENRKPTTIFVEK